MKFTYVANEKLIYWIIKDCQYFLKIRQLLNPLLGEHFSFVVRVVVKLQNLHFLSLFQIL